MHIFTSCILVTIFAILTSSIAIPTPNPQDVDVSADGIDVIIDQPIDTIDSAFTIRIISTTAQTPSFNLDYVSSGGSYKLALNNGPGLVFTLVNKILSTTDPRVENSGLRFVASTSDCMDPVESIIMCVMCVKAMEQR